MEQYNIRISAASYKKLQKKLLQYKIKIGGQELGTFLIANSVIDDVAHERDLRAKRIILHIARDFDSSPGDLHNDIRLADHLAFGFTEYTLLRRRLDRLAKEYKRTAKIGLKVVNECQTVNDCINLVNAQISEA